MQTVTLIVPCYNESDSIPILYNALCKVASGVSDRFQFTYLFVNDGSKDHTLKVLEDLAIADRNVKYISFSRNFGKEAAMLAGMRNATGDFVGIIDADMQHSPDLIPLMLEAVTAEGYDVAAACRSDRTGEAKFKSFLSANFYKVINKISEIDIMESAQDYRIMKKDVVDAILSMPEHDRFSKGIFTWVGFNVKWFEHENQDRVAGQTTWSIKSLMRYAIDGILAFSNTPLKFSFGLSVLSGLTALALLITMLVRAIVFSHTPIDYVPTLLLPLSMIFLIAALIFMVLGIMGMYIARIFNESRNRPHYIIAKTNISKNFGLNGRG